MQPETVQIGPLVISKIVFEVIVPVAAAFVGGILGWIASYWSTKKIEDRRYRQELEREFHGDQRKAIGVALQTLRYLYRVATPLKIFAELFKNKQVVDNALFDETKLREEYDKTFSRIKDLGKRQLPKDGHQALLPDDCGKELILIVSELMIVRMVNERPIKIDTAIAAVDNMLGRIEKLETKLQKLYRETYGPAAIDRVAGIKIVNDKEIKKIFDEKMVSQQPSPLITSDLYSKIMDTLTSLRETRVPAIVENWLVIRESERKLDDSVKVMFDAWIQLAQDYKNLENQMKLNQAVLAAGELLTKYLSFIPVDNPNHASLRSELQSLIDAEKSEQARLTVISRRAKIPPNDQSDSTLN